MKMKELAESRRIEVRVPHALVKASIGLVASLDERRRMAEHNLCGPWRSCL